MDLLPFAAVRHTLSPGMPLPYGVRNAAGELLLARGQLVAPDQLDLLLERGAFVDASDTRTQPDEAPPADPLGGGPMASRWEALEMQLANLLRTPSGHHFLSRVREALVHIAGFASGDSDQLIYLILRHDHSRLSNYGVSHSLHTAALCGLLARRLGWPNGRCTTAVGAALTMNLSMLDLQGVLATRGEKPSEAERAVIEAHPQDSARILRNAGLQDDEWLAAVEQHHEVPGGSGYPQRLVAPSDMSQLLRFVDVFTAKHSPRAGRTPLPAHQAARDLFVQAQGNPMASLLIKELGIFPPGCCVQLANGEIGVVVRVGNTAKTPVVAALTNPRGDALAVPSRRDTARPEFAVVQTVPESQLRVTLLAEQLYRRAVV